MSLSAAPQTCPVNSTSHWLQSLSCGMHQPSTVSPVMAHAAYVAGYWFLPVAILVAVIVISTITARSRASRNRDRRVARDLA